MIRNFKKFMIYTFTVLCSKLVYDASMKLLPVIKSTKNPYLDVAIGMTLTLIIFYPFYGFAHKWVEKFSGHYVKHARKIHKNSFVALLIGYSIGVFILFACFMLVKFNINILQEVYDAIIPS
jgi:uncharacterized protein YacL